MIPHSASNKVGQSVLQRSVKPKNQRLTPIRQIASGSPFATGNAPASVTVDPTGRFAYVINSTDNTVSAYSTDANGALTPVRGSPFATGHVPRSVTVDPTGRFAYITNFNDNTVSGYSIGANGALRQVTGSPFAGGNKPASVTVSPTEFVYVVNEQDTEHDSTVSAYSIQVAERLYRSRGRPSQRRTTPYQSR